MSNKILFLITYGNVHCVVYAFDREAAKRDARLWLFGDPDEYTVSPLTTAGDRIHLSVTLFA